MAVNNRMMALRLRNLAQTLREGLIAHERDWRGHHGLSACITGADFRTISSELTRIARDEKSVIAEIESIAEELERSN